MVKTATIGLFMDKLSEIDLVCRGMWEGCFAIDNEKKLDKFVFVWFDKDRRNFISNTSSLKPGMSYARYRLIHVDDIPNADPIRV